MKRLTKSQYEAIVAIMRYQYKMSNSDQKFRLDMLLRDLIELFEKTDTEFDRNKFQFEIYATDIREAK